MTAGGAEVSPARELIRIAHPCSTDKRTLHVVVIFRRLHAWLDWISDHALLQSYTSANVAKITSHIRRRPCGRSCRHVAGSVIAHDLVRQRIRGSAYAFCAARRSASMAWRSLIIVLIASCECLGTNTSRATLATGVAGEHANDRSACVASLPHHFDVVRLVGSSSTKWRATTGPARLPL